ETATSKALEPAKTTEEKDLFAGLNLAVPSGDGAVQGDFAFNRTVASLSQQLRGASSFADSGVFGLKIKKGSEDGKDPRHMTLGFQLRKTVLLANKTDLDKLREAIRPGANPEPNDFPHDALTRIRSRFFRAFLADYGFQMEGDVSQKGVANVSNLILDF